VRHIRLSEYSPAPVVHSTSILGARGETGNRTTNRKGGNRRSTECGRAVTGNSEGATLQGMAISEFHLPDRTARL